MDMEAELIDHQIPENINSELIYAVRNKFIGETEQITPIFSAAKVNGKRLYKFARSGEKIEKPLRKIFIEEFDITRISLPEIDFEITCSKGTYIRAIANDFGDKLNCGGVLKSLRRTKIGDLNVKDAFEINDFIKKVSSDEIFSTQV
jgi:tRNA pseudouridine55 synthase